MYRWAFHLAGLGPLAECIMDWMDLVNARAEQLSSAITLTNSPCSQHKEQFVRMGKKSLEIKWNAVSQSSRQTDPLSTEVGSFLTLVHCFSCDCCLTSETEQMLFSGKEWVLLESSTAWRRGNFKYLKYYYSLKLQYITSTNIYRSEDLCIRIC